MRRTGWTYSQPAAERLYRQKHARDVQQPPVPLPHASTHREGPEYSDTQTYSFQHCRCSFIHVVSPLHVRNGGRVSSSPARPYPSTMRIARRNHGAITFGGQSITISSS